MIIGECPYCNETECNAIPGSADLPVLGKVQCAKCGEVYWLKYSRVEPKAYKLDYFKEGDIKLVDNSDK